MAHLPLGVLSYTICQNLSSDVKDWCWRAWQNCRSSQLQEMLSGHKLWPTLEFCLRQHQLWDALTPEFQHIIHQSRLRYALRQLTLFSQLRELDLALAKVSGEALLLKGSALLFYPLYPTYGERATVDIDLLADSEHLTTLVSVLTELGYTHQERDCGHHLAPFVRPQSLNIEVHHLLPGHHIHPEIQITAQTTAEFRALKLPAVNELFWHMALHAWFNYPQLRNILDLYRLRNLYAVDDAFLAQRAQAEGLQPYWSRMMTQLQEFEQGDLKPNTIQTWEWYPASGFQDRYFEFTFGRSRADRWRWIFSPNHKYPTGVLSKVLFLPTILWRLGYYGIGLSSVWLITRLKLVLAFWYRKFWVSKSITT